MCIIQDLSTPSTATTFLSSLFESFASLKAAPLFIKDLPLPKRDCFASPRLTILKEYQDHKLECFH